MTLPEKEAEVRMDARLFGESPSRIVLSAAPERVARIQELAAAAGAPICVLGTVGGETLEIAAEGTTLISRPVAEMERTWRGALEALL